MTLWQSRQFGRVGQAHRRNRRRPIAFTRTRQADVPSEVSIRHLDVPGHLDVVPYSNRLTEQTDQFAIGFSLGRSRKQLRKWRDAVHTARMQCRWAEQMRFDGRGQP